MSSMSTNSSSFSSSSALSTDLSSDILDDNGLRFFQETELSNEEILEYLSIYCKRDDGFQYLEYIKLLASKYDMRIETNPLEIQILSLRTMFNKEALKKFYSVMKEFDFYSLYRNVIHYYQNDICAPVYFETLRELFNVIYTEEFIRDTISFINSPIPLPKEREKISKEDDILYEKTIFNGVAETRSILTPDEKNQVQSEDDLMAGAGIDAMIRHLFSKLDAIANFVDKPTYIAKFDIDVNTLPQLKEKGITKYMSVEEIADFILNQIEFSTDNYELFVSDLNSSNSESSNTSLVTNKEEFVRNKLIDKLKTFSFAQIEDLAKKFATTQREINLVQDNVNLFRVLGPVNPSADIDYSELTIDLKDDDGNLTGETEPDEDKIFGGARMFLDLTSEYDEEQDEHLSEWFFGSCIQCHSRIKYKHYAVRQPIITGGWFGCYCSWDCVRDYTQTIYENQNVSFKFRDLEYEHEGNSDNDDNSDEDEEIKEENANLRNVYETQIALIDKFEEQMLKFGIADRVDPERDNGRVNDDDNDDDNEEYRTKQESNREEIIELARRIDHLMMGEKADFDLPEIDTSVLQTVSDSDQEDEDSDN